MTRFMVDGKMVELDEIIEKAGKYDKLMESIGKSRTQDPPKWWLDECAALKEAEG